MSTDYSSSTVTLSRDSHTEVMRYLLTVTETAANRVRNNLASWDLRRRQSEHHDRCFFPECADTLSHTSPVGLGGGAEAFNRLLNGSVAGEGGDRLVAVLEEAGIQDALKVYRHRLTPSAAYWTADAEREHVLVAELEPICKAIQDSTNMRGVALSEDVYASLSASVQDVEDRVKVIKAAIEGQDWSELESLGKGLLPQWNLLAAKSWMVSDLVTNFLPSPDQNPIIRRAGHPVDAC